MAAKSPVSGRFWVTCYTDASYSQNDGGGWAFWLTGPDRRIVRHGPCPRWVKSSNGAELAAIFAAIYTARVEWKQRCRGVLVCSDSRFALEIAEGKHPMLARKRKPADIDRLAQRIQETLLLGQMQIRARWVKGHQKARGAAPFLNGECDRLSREARKSSRVAARKK